MANKCYYLLFIYFVSETVCDPSPAYPHRLRLLGEMRKGLDLPKKIDFKSLKVHKVLGIHFLLLKFP